MATATPIARQPANPGPQVTAITSGRAPANTSNTRSTRNGKFVRCSRLARSGTTPPYSSCKANWLWTHSSTTPREGSNIARADSSQELSMPRIIFPRGTPPDGKIKRNRSATTFTMLHHHQVVGGLREAARTRCGTDFKTFTRFATAPTDSDHRQVVSGLREAARTKLGTDLTLLRGRGPRRQPLRGRGPRRQTPITARL